MRIESALLVKRVKVGFPYKPFLIPGTDVMQTKGHFNGNVWLGFERLTCVPIQTRMVKESMLSKEEKQWIKVRLSMSFVVGPMNSLSNPIYPQEHNQRCRDKLEPYLKDDKRALKWLRREAERGIGIVGAGPGGISIDWD